MVTPRDIAWIVALPGMVAASWLLPEQVCALLCRLSAQVCIRVRRARTAVEADCIRRMLGARAMADLDIDAVVATLKANYYLDRLQIFRCHRFGRWSPPVTLQGQHHVEAALARGKGAIIYVQPSLWNHVAIKAAFYSAGLPLVHVSRPDHGFCKTRFGRRFLNPIQISAECRFLKERFVVEDDARSATLPELLRRLGKNQLISIIAGPQGRRSTVFPFLCGAIRLATGPAVLALKSGAPLLPAVTIRKPDGTFATIVTAPVEPETNENLANQVTGMLADCVRGWEAHVLAAPDQFGAWSDTVLPGASEITHATATS